MLLLGVFRACIDCRWCWPCVVVLLHQHFTHRALNACAGIAQVLHPTVQDLTGCVAWGVLHCVTVGHAFRQVTQGIARLLCQSSFVAARGLITWHHHHNMLSQNVCHAFLTLPVVCISKLNAKPQQGSCNRLKVLCLGRCQQKGSAICRLPAAVHQRDPVAKPGWSMQDFQVACLCAFELSPQRCGRIKDKCHQSTVSRVDAH